MIPPSEDKLLGAAFDYDRACLVIDNWLLLHSGSIDPMRHASTSEALFRRKCFNELVVYLLLQENYGCIYRLEALEALQQHVLARDWERIIWLSSRSAAAAITFALPIAYALKFKAVSEPMDARARAILISDYVWGFERPAHRLLEIAYACEVANITPRVSMLDVAKSSSLAIPPCSLMSSRDGYYGLSHSAVYLGLSAAQYDLSEEANDAIEGGICWALEVGDLDLGLELALAAAIFGRVSWGGVQMANRAALMAINAGAISTPSTSGIRNFVEACPAEVHFGVNYHTTLVAGLALPALLPLVTKGSDALASLNAAPSKIYGQICAYAHCGRNDLVANLTVEFGRMNQPHSWRRQYTKAANFVGRISPDQSIGQA